MNTQTRHALLVRIRSYLGNGGLFNPEYMEHEKVRDLLLDIKDALIDDIPNPDWVICDKPEVFHFDWSEDPGGRLFRHFRDECGIWTVEELKPE